MSGATGACLCGAVRFSVAPPYRWFAHCHCSMCRKQRGALFATGVGVARRNFAWLAGAAAVVHYRATEAFERPFCAHCGSKVPAEASVGDALDVPAGNIEGDFGARPEKHLFTASKSPSTRITDRLPQFDAYPPRTPLRAVDRPRPAPSAGATRGSCLCGGVVWEISGAPKGAVNCHCSRCRRSRGTAFATNSLVPAERLRFMGGQDLIRSYRIPDAARYGTRFCGSCGSLVPSIVPSFGAIVPVGSLDGDAEVPVRAHIFVGSKAAWHEITDDLPQYAEHPPPDVIQQLFF